VNKKKLQTEQTKKKIADAVKTLFVQKGYKATSIEDIVKATGCSAGNIYYHFKSKEGLFLYLMDEWNREWEENWLAKEPLYTTTVDKLYAMADHLAQDHLTHPLTRAADEFFSNAEKASDIEERIADMVKGFIDFNQKLLQQGIDKGEFNQQNAAALAIILDGLFSGLSPHLRRMELKEIPATYKLAMDVFLHGIVRSPS